MHSIYDTLYACVRFSGGGVASVIVYILSIFDICIR